MAGTGRLDRRTAVVTGGCSGIGLATVRRFAAEGAHVVIGDVDDQRGPGIAEGVGGLYVNCDVTDAQQVDAMFAAADSKYGSVDVAFNNAGISPPDDASILDTGIEAWRRVQEVNLTSVYLCCKAVLPYMCAQRRGSIINTASFVAVMGAATSQISYSASKGGVLAMSRELGVQIAREGIRVNALCPGPGGSRRRRVPLPTDLRRATTPSPTLSTVTTVKVARRGETSIRVIGIDIPETVHPTEPVGCGGPRASRLATRLLTGEQVGLVFAVRKLRSCRGHPLRSPLTIIPRHQPLVADHELDATFVRFFDGRTQSPSRRNTENNHGVRDSNPEPAENRRRLTGRSVVVRRAC